MSVNINSHVVFDLELDVDDNSSPFQRSLLFWQSNHLMEQERELQQQKTQLALKKLKNNQNLPGHKTNTSTDNESNSHTQSESEVKSWNQPAKEVEKEKVKEKTNFASESSSSAVKSPRRQGKSSSILSVKSVKGTSPSSSSSSSSSPRPRRYSAPLTNISSLLSFWQSLEEKLKNQQEINKMREQRNHKKGNQTATRSARAFSSDVDWGRNASSPADSSHFVDFEIGRQHFKQQRLSLILLQNKKIVNKNKTQKFNQNEPKQDTPTGKANDLDVSTSSHSKKPSYDKPLPALPEGSRKPFPPLSISVTAPPNTSNPPEAPASPPRPVRPSAESIQSSLKAVAAAPSSPTATSPKPSLPPRPTIISKTNSPAPAPSSASSTSNVTNPSVNNGSSASSSQVPSSLSSWVDQEPAPSSKSSTSSSKSDISDRSTIREYKHHRGVSDEKVLEKLALAGVGPLSFLSPAVQAVMTSTTRPSTASNSSSNSNFRSNPMLAITPSISINPSALSMPQQPPSPSLSPLGSSSSSSSSSAVSPISSTPSSPKTRSTRGISSRPTIAADTFLPPTSPSQPTHHKTVSNPDILPFLSLGPSVSPLPSMGGSVNISGKSVSVNPSALSNSTSNSATSSLASSSNSSSSSSSPPGLSSPRLSPHQADPLESRRRVKLEIFTTEEKYCQHLKTLVDIYIHPLKSSCEKMDISPNQVALMFSNVEILANLHAVLFESFLLIPLLQPTDPRDDDKEKKSDKDIAQIFLRYSDFLKLYKIYLNDYSAMLVTIDACRKKRKFVQFLADAKRRTGLDLLSYLIMPVQRIPRYELLLRELIKTSSPLDDTRDLQDALLKIHSIAEIVNLSRTQMETMSRLVELQNNIEGDFGSLLQPNRQWICDGPISLQEASALSIFNAKPKLTPCILYLFSDILLLVSRSDHRFKAHRILESIYVNPVYEKDSNRFGFKVTDREDASTMSSFSSTTLIFVCEGEGDRNRWVEFIRNTQEDTIQKMEWYRRRRVEARRKKAEILDGQRQERHTSRTNRGSKEFSVSSSNSLEISISPSPNLTPSPSISVASSSSSSAFMSPSTHHPSISISPMPAPPPFPGHRRHQSSRSNFSKSSGEVNIQEVLTLNPLLLADPIIPPPSGSSTSSVPSAKLSSGGPDVTAASASMHSFIMDKLKEVAARKSAATQEAKSPRSPNSPK